MLQKLNHLLEKWIPLITPASVITGVLLAVWLKPYTFLVPWIFAVMTFAGSLSLNFKDLKRAIMHPVPIVVCTLLLHLIMPGVAWIAGNLLFNGDAYTITGLVLAFTIPTGIISFMWSSIYGGNVALTLTIILVNTLLAPFLVPYSLSLFVGAAIKIDTWTMMQGLLLMIALPSVMGMLLNQATKGKVEETIGKPLAPFQKVGLSIVIALNSSVVAPYLNDINQKLVLTALVVLSIASLGYLLGWQVSRLLKWDRGVIIAMTFNSGMRNISAGAVLAITYFPAPVALPVVVGMLFQQLLASTYGRLLFRHYGFNEEATSIKAMAQGK